MFILTVTTTHTHTQIYRHKILSIRVYCQTLNSTYLSSFSHFLFYPKSYERVRLESCNASKPSIKCCSLLFTFITCPVAILISLISLSSLFALKLNYFWLLALTSSSLVQLDHFCSYMLRIDEITSRSISNLELISGHVWLETFSLFVRFAFKIISFSLFEFCRI